MFSVGKFGFIGCTQQQALRIHSYVLRIFLKIQAERKLLASSKLSSYQAISWAKLLANL